MGLRGCPPSMRGMSIIDAPPAQTAAADQGQPKTQPTMAMPSIDLTQPPATSRPTFTITDAASACAVSRKTITRKLGDLAGHGASKDEDGIWRIPVEALLAVGLHPGRSVPQDARPPAVAPMIVAPPAASAATAPPAVARSAPEPDMVSVTRERWDDLRLRLARAEAEASERAAALADARLALRALTATPHRAEPVAPVAPVAPAQPPVAPRKRRWWQAKEPTA